ncbi:hypothetical protein V1477_011189, partial [Vespula maculifrons]
MFNRELESNCLLKSNILDFGFTFYSATTLKIRSSSNSSGSSGSSVSSLQHDFDVTAILESSERDRSSAVGYGLARGGLRLITRILKCLPRRARETQN